MPKKIDIVSDYFIKKAFDDSNKCKNDLTNKKLQKLLYYAQAWSLVLHNKKLFNEKFEAWIHGPANPHVYQRFKKFGFNPIALEIDDSVIKKLEGDEIKLLDTIWYVYGKYDAEYLEVLSHSEVPWQEARGELQPFESSSNTISISTMKEYYEQKQKRTQKG